MRFSALVAPLFTLLVGPLSALSLGVNVSHAALRPQPMALQPLPTLSTTPAPPTELPFRLQLGVQGGLEGGKAVVRTSPPATPARPQNDSSMAARLQLAADVMPSLLVLGLFVDLGVGSGYDDYRLGTRAGFRLPSSNFKVLVELGAHGVMNIGDAWLGGDSDISDVSHAFGGVRLEWAPIFERFASPLFSVAVRRDFGSEEVKGKITTTSTFIWTETTVQDRSYRVGGMTVALTAGASFDFFELRRKRPRRTYDMPWIMP